MLQLWCNSILSLETNLEIRSENDKGRFKKDKRQMLFGKQTFFLSFFLSYLKIFIERIVTRPFIVTSPACDYQGAAEACAVTLRCHLCYVQIMLSFWLQWMDLNVHLILSVSWLIRDLCIFSLYNNVKKKKSWSFCLFSVEQIHIHNRPGTKRK